MNVQHNAKTERALLDQTAQRYRDRGYDVIVEPSEKQRPDFLRKYCPDLIAQKGDEHVVVELKTKYPRDSDKWLSELAGVVERQPGWRFDLAIADLGVSGEEELPLADVLRRQVREASRMLEAGQAVAGGLLMWASLEGAARLAAASAGIEIAPSTAGRAFLRELVVEGLLEDEDYEACGAAWERRNTVAHGFASTEGDTEVFAALQPVVMLLLDSVPAEAGE